MPLDASFVGRVYPPTDAYEVGREKIREFADAIGDPNPAYRDREAAKSIGHPDVIAPPTFAIVVTIRASRQVIADPELGLDYSRVVHGEQRFVHARPIRAGDSLTTVVSVEDIRSAAGNDIITTKSDVSTVDGEPVVTAYATLVVRGAGS
ncbi:MAG TPA: MaoC family dehydratase N-terminal domain-containing protein [Jatrophihabitantaceae bacterium]